MAKVEAHGIRGNYSRWIRNWLTGRTQRVVIHDETSDPALVTSGVPQGSVLGPLLFIIYYSNDLDVGIISKINKFADDTKLCHRAFTERDRATIQSDLNRLLQWTETWQMSFNIKKCSNKSSSLLARDDEARQQQQGSDEWTGDDGGDVDCGDGERTVPSHDAQGCCQPCLRKPESASRPSLCIMGWDCALSITTINITTVITSPLITTLLLLPCLIITHEKR
ncbi:Reverse transcriptase domain [Trinorchestia longiramus]|nr:Reverse transcriptase domain [Trinorchestia longiramus]